MIAGQLLIELKKVEQLRFFFQFGELGIQLGKVGARAVALLFQKAHVILPLKIQQLLLLLAQRDLLPLDFIADRGLHILAFLGPQFPARADVLLHDRIQIQLRKTRLRSRWR